VHSISDRRRFAVTAEISKSAIAKRQLQYRHDTDE